MNLLFKKWFTEKYSRDIEDWRIKLGLDTRYTVPVRKAMRKTYSYMLTESQRLRNDEVRHLHKFEVK